jgi:hypothetical protein
MSLLVLLACSKMTTGTYEGHLSAPSPAWQNSVGQSIILDCSRTDEPADDFHFKMVETEVLAGLVGLLEDRDSSAQRLSMGAITTFAEFGRFIYHFGLCED